MYIISVTCAQPHILRTKLVCVNSEPKKMKLRIVVKDTTDVTIRL